MKKAAFLVLVLILALSTVATAEDFDFSNLKNMKIVRLDYGFDFEAMMNDVFAQQQEIPRKPRENFHIVTNSTNEALMMLHSGRADVLITFLPTAEYIAMSQEDLAVVPVIIMTDLHIVTRANQSEALDKINAALAEMKSEGVIEDLYEKHVTAVLEGAEPEAVEMPVFEGATIFYVGVGGDAPPIDYVSADGKPAGFNTAMLAELGTRTGMNIEILPIENDARFAAIQSGKIDAFFWQIQFDSATTFEVDASSIDDAVPEGLLLSDPYYQVLMAFVVNK